MNFPYVHVAGDTLDFPVTVADYPSSDGWTLKYYLTPRFSTPAQAQVVLTAIANTDGTYQVQESPANTALWKPGAYGWARLVEKVGARQTLTGSENQGEVLVRQDPSAAVQGYDSRSHARKTLEAIEAVIEERATKDQEEYSIAGRSLKRTPLAELRAMRDDYRAEVAAEDAEERLNSGQAGGSRLLARL